jgi:hypothetical protein
VWHVDGLGQGADEDVGRSVAALACGGDRAHAVLAHVRQGHRRAGLGPQGRSSPAGILEPSDL